METMGFAEEVIQHPQPSSENMRIDASGWVCFGRFPPFPGFFGGKMSRFRGSKSYKSWLVTRFPILGREGKKPNGMLKMCWEDGE